MGIVIGIIIDVVVTAAATAAEAAADAAAAALAEAAAEAAADAAAEAAADAAAEAEAEGAAETAAESEAESAATGSGEGASIATKVLRGIAKLSELIKDFFGIDSVFKIAMSIIHDIEGSSPRGRKLEKYLKVLIEMGKKMNGIKEWIENHQKDTVKLEGIDVPVDSGVLSKYMSPLTAGVGHLRNISNNVENQNKQNKAMTETQLDAMRRCLVKVNTTFEQLAKFIDEKKSIVKVLSSFPINKDEVNNWKSELEN
ncbi:uncharacterized protein LOC127722144 isoform X3 [Mytilus californianus]|uniref:uncharacterized protein LOC127722144 isoform X3 n=1 Tax=Mytilus californianus TaxID=6549 RepID=UPI0022475A74|nr:uncharacterized protein LOC127722144 isoform X3 [Mytilus californianus]